MSTYCSGFLHLLPMLAVAQFVTAQSSQGLPRPAPDNSPSTFQVNTRVVLTDVTVTDGKGNPIQGLKREDFEVFDNGRPQELASFEEHTEQRTAPGEFEAAAATVFSNDIDAHPPPVVNILLIDTTTISLIDQMYLCEQLTRFVRDLPPGEPVAVFSRAGPVTVPLQSFTTNKQLLMAAIREAIPHFGVPVYRHRTGDDSLWQIAWYVSQIPGRKNILWFSGGSNAFLRPVPVATMPRQLLYDMLEKQRIALYPIDARGLTGLTEGFGMWIGAQQMQMAQDAKATGGRAYYNTNGLADAAQKVLNTDGDYYTLSYTPENLRQDRNWHNVTVKVRGYKGGYQLSYRRGYYDDGENNAAPEPKMRTLLRTDGSRVQVLNNRSQSIVFEATVSQGNADSQTDIPAKPIKKGETAFRIHYTLPASSIAPAVVNGNTGMYVVGAAILALNRYGEPIAGTAGNATLKVNEASIHADPNMTLTFVQQINLPHGEDYLNVLLYDTITGRLGMMSVPINVSKPMKR